MYVFSLLISDKVKHSKIELVRKLKTFIFDCYVMMIDIIALIGTYYGT